MADKIILGAPRVNVVRRHNGTDAIVVTFDRVLSDEELSVFRAHTFSFNQGKPTSAELIELSRDGHA